MQTFSSEAMQQQWRSFWIASAASFALVAPFAALEAITSRGFRNGAPVALFVVMWLLPLAFFMVLAPVTRHQRPRLHDWTGNAALLARVGSLAVIAWLWVGLVGDQLPCFLGAANCD